MIPPREQIIHQICTTSLCWPKDPKTGALSGCSNCTRLLAHEKKRYFMTPEQFRLCVTVARDFVYESPICPQGRKMKVIGCFGGEPLMVPCFDEYVDIMCELIPEPEHRGLWTSVDWMTYTGPKYGAAKPLVERLLGTENGIHKGYLNWNMHTPTNECQHHGNLIAIQDMIPDKKEMWGLINKCWLNRDWSACYALDHNGEPKFYFCELASSFDRVMNLGIGLPVVPRIWNFDLRMVPDEDGILQPHGAYADQIKATCPKCGQALPLKEGRRDLDYKDDVSRSNLELLQIAGSPMIERGDYEVIEGYEKPTNPHHPGTYIKKGVILSTKVPR